MQDAFRGKPSQFEFTTVNARIFDSNFIPVRAPAGHIQYLLGVTEDITERKQAEMALDTGLQGMRALHAIISDQALSFGDKIQALLSMGCQRFGLSIGIMSHIEGDRYQVMEVVAPGAAIVCGSIFSTGRTYCSETIKTTDIVCFEHAKESGWKSHPAYADMQLEAYIAIAVRVQGEVYGTINFSSPEPRRTPFTDTDKEILKLMAHWVESELERQQTEAVTTRLGRILDDSSNEIYIFDAKSLAFLQANQGAQQNLGYSMEELTRLTPVDLKPEHTRESFEAVLVPLRRGEQNMVVFFSTHRRKDGSLYPVEVRLHLSNTGSPPVFVAIIQDITERRQVEERLSYLAHYDTLTGLPNRVLLQDRLNQAMIEADRQDRMVAIMFLDLDRFKIINDTLGHETGDVLLKEVAGRLLGSVRAGDTIARLGGDEFTVVLANVTQVDDVAHIAQKIIDSFASPFHVGGRELFVSTSIGITLYPFDDNNLDGLLRNADASMYQAKEMGRNTFQFYTAEINWRTTKRLALETALRHALERNELELHYQPQVNLKTGKITGAEALLRWHHPEMGLVAPLEFIPLAEETGLIIPIGEWVLRTACAQAQTWHLSGCRGFQIAVNLSARQIQQRSFAKEVEGILRQTGLDPRQLDLELTESLIMQNTDTTLAAMDELNAIGAIFSMDDFGTGYSSLGYLKRFPIDTLKIDQSFMRDIPGDLDDAAIAQAIIAMAHSLKIRVIAEGVETAKQLAFLRYHKCDGIQGYYFSKPIPAAAMTRLLENDQRLKWRRPVKAKPRTPRAASKRGG
jgi:diguanylate cyclase (GGDEF)-like protein/PAS domain S-box-containing protein